MGSKGVQLILGFFILLILLLFELLLLHFQAHLNNSYVILP